MILAMAYPYRSICHVAAPAVYAASVDGAERNGSAHRAAIAARTAQRPLPNPPTLRQLCRSKPAGGSGEARERNLVHGA